MNKEEIEELVEFLYEEPEIKVLSKEEKNILYLENLYNELTFKNIDLQQENKQLKDRIEKAVEYIENRFVGEEIQQGEDWNYFEHWYFETIDKYEAEELLEILKGDNKED